MANGGTGGVEVVAGVIFMLLRVKKSMKNIHWSKELSVSLEKHDEHKRLMSKLGTDAAT